MTDLIPGSLQARIAAATGINVTDFRDRHLVTGIFNRYRPDGAGLQDLLFGEGVEKAVLSRLMRIYAATSAGWDPASWYFIVDQPVVATRHETVQMAERYLNGLKIFSGHIGESELSSKLSNLSVVSEPPTDAIEDDDLSTEIYECLTDFLAEPQNQDEIFLLKEAVYSIANDYYLMAFVLWPAIRNSKGLGDALDAYFELWRHGLELQYFEGDVVAVVSKPR